ncbi:Peptidoglycan/xylan/chitin deacetylase, PgdA/CDA1 family [Devosia sp. YR412]|uniref:polysaccharide deacetylase family protein n=1 Tax=Devosia sp. YR412 TaxID=1881030 RepID=UPI0008ADC8E6|nr:polysaccharide deacetylase family protein [Devosia sp. YR412]SEQ43870.1 Peptidoglycan/xylan/chitin deacetylase, PgdA/CDA1 family [Devosia sp. YR412]
MLSRVVLSAVLLSLALTGCAKPPSPNPTFTQVADRAAITNNIFKVSAPMLDQPMPERIFATGNIGGRTLAVATTTDIILRPGEVVLTFDDGPRPHKTERILATLNDFGAKATFLMLGSAAQAHPKLAQTVAASGHTVGSHTFDHTDLSTLTSQAALDEIARGERAVQTALAGGGQTMAPFFRFPYLSQTGFLRTNLLQGNMVVLDVDIDSKDYYKDTPEVVVARTIVKLEARGSGVILFHDIHQRTVDMLPLFLAELKDKGYSVVRLVPKDTSIFGRDMITADAPLLRGTL